MRQRVITAFCASLIGAVGLSALLVAAPSDSPVADAAMRGDSAAVRTLLKDAADVNAAQGDGMTALHWAAMHGELQTVQMLLYAGANVKAATRLGPFTPLFLAAKYGHADVVTALLKAGADPKVATANGATPLMMAAASGDTATVAVLLDHGADINAREAVRGETALMFAAAYDRPAIITLLTRHGARVGDATGVVDLAALSRKDPRRLRALLFGNPPPPPSRKKAATKAGAGPKAGAGSGVAAEADAKEAGVGKGNAASEPAKAAAAKGRRQQPPARVAGSAPAGADRVGAKDKKKSQDEGDDEFDYEASLTKQRKTPQVPGVDRTYLMNELVGAQGGLTPLLFAARQGYGDAVQALLSAGADVNQVSADRTSPLLVATINGHFDLAKYLLDHGANPNLAAENGVTPLYAVLNCEWAPKALYPQPQSYKQQKTTYLALMQDLLQKSARPNVRLAKKVWYSGYSFDLSGVDEIGATPFWRAAYADDIEAMKLLVKYGADPDIPTMKPAGRPFTGGGARRVKDVSGLPPVPVGGPGVPPLLAAAGEGYGEGFAANSHRFAPTGMLAAVKYLVEVLHADVNATDHEGNTALHNAAARGDNQMILYLVSKGANVKAVNRAGQTTVDMANGPVQRIQPFPGTIKLLEGLGAKNNHHCVSC